MARMVTWQTLRGFARGLSVGQSEMGGPGFLSPLSPERTSWDASPSPFDQWRALEFRILTPPSNEGWPH
jgi:hypothetical protein